MMWNLVSSFSITAVRLCFMSVLSQLFLLPFYADAGNGFRSLLKMILIINPIVFVSCFLLIWLPVLFIQRKFVEECDNRKSLFQEMFPVAMLPVLILFFTSGIFYSLPRYQAVIMMFNVLEISALGFYLFLTSYKQLSWKTI